jgi:hypothetical protein
MFAFYWTYDDAADSSVGCLTAQSAFFGEVWATLRLSDCIWLVPGTEDF